MLRQHSVFSIRICAEKQKEYERQLKEYVIRNHSLNPPRKTIEFFSKFHSKLKEHMRQFIYYQVMNELTREAKRNSHILTDQYEKNWDVIYPHIADLEIKYFEGSESVSQLCFDGKVFNSPFKLPSGSKCRAPRRNISFLIEKIKENDVDILIDEENESFHNALFSLPDDSFEFSSFEPFHDCEF